ncbi:uncharacterized protein MYCFIDRAFT_87647 [Pseudocercospora fijiensis CIRAD86]|uniref:Cryptic loci regulator 2 N-terminal domain-containing protein n=1 Tax=Pseudocercospora fijiensis (strain CIRAD86) TaxID=383855 RepID=M3AZY5_PSEFD|nr:uncharacterized protein MYCFIDRAFT_87647 [Pseudocercospora fijiensis CIRAD86]EME82732.1 hypothetical protein MYCFIDRAFT_87647 [Pseudocercospora fijiensis CIRAD86]
MSSPVIIPIALDSDGTYKIPVQTSGDSLPYIQNDEHFLTKVAEYWMKQQKGSAPKPGTYRLQRLPPGYSGWEKKRSTDGKHTDRWMYGHPNGTFRSIIEFFPHLKHLQDFGGTVGCPCKLCAGTARKTARSSGSGSTGSPGDRSNYFPIASSSKAVPFPAKPKVKPKKVNHDLSIPERAKQVDKEGIPDIYRDILDVVKDAGPEGIGYREFKDRLSPDWRAGHQELLDLLIEWSELPSFMPRYGEVVLFTRSISPDEGIAWDTSSNCLRRWDLKSKIWLDRPRWEAGVVTQLPLEPLTADDLERIPDVENRKQGITLSGFRVEPLNQPGSTLKSSGQHKYVPLHAIRPFSCWKECVGASEDDWHPTIRHALTVASSFCVIGKHLFTGSWPSATLFVRGLYIGAELILLGDAVRLTPNTTDARHETPNTTVTDVLVVSSLRLRFVNLEEATDDDYDESRSYNICLHVLGKAYSLDPKRSFGGIGKSPVRQGHTGFPTGLFKYGTWFHVNDPTNAKERLEIPYTKVVGKCLEYDTLRAWFSTPPEMASAPAFQAVNTKRPTLSHGSKAILDARAYSLKHDSRIDKGSGKTWFWTETRIEQLDLHEINGRFVGVKDENRTNKQIHAWRQALKVLDGKRGGVEDYQAALKLREDEKRESMPSAFGMMATAGQEDSATDAEQQGRIEAMDVDEDEGLEDALAAQLAPSPDQGDSEMDEDLMILE